MIRFFRRPSTEPLQGFSASFAERFRRPLKGLSYQRYLAYDTSYLYYTTYNNWYLYYTTYDNWYLYYTTYNNWYL